jgi:hypothetical protein
LPKFEAPKFDVPKFELPNIELPKFDIPKVDIPAVELPKVDLPKVEVPEQVSALADRGVTFVQDSVKSAHQTADSVRKNITTTVVLVREAVGI